MPDNYLNEFALVRETINELMDQTKTILKTGDYSNYKQVMKRANDCKDELSTLRERLIDSMQSSDKTSSYKTALIYLTVLQESQEMLSVMRHQLRAAGKLLK